MSPTVSHGFDRVITTEAQLRAVLGVPTARAVDKEITELDGHARAYIGLSSFVLIASGDGASRVDVSPKGDPPGFVRVLDAHTLAIPDRPGNRRADTFLNVLRHPAVGLLFLIPGRPETLRVAGRASIVGDRALMQTMAVQGRPPRLALVVTVERLYFHCARCALRSRLWDVGGWPDHQALSSHAQCLVDHARLDESAQSVQAALDLSYRTQLY